MADTLVNLVTVPIYGKDSKYSKAKIGKHSFAQWAINVKHLLKSYHQLAKEKLLPRDAITPSAMSTLWMTLLGLEDSPKGLSHSWHGSCHLRHWCLSAHCLAQKLAQPDHCSMRT